MLYRQPVACRDGSKPVCVQHALAPDSMPVHCAVVGMLKTRLSINPSEWAVYLLRYQSQRAGLRSNRLFAPSLCAGLRELHFDLVKVHFGEALQDAGAPQVTAAPCHGCSWRVQAVWSRPLPPCRGRTCAVHGRLLR